LHSQSWLPKISSLVAPNLVVTFKPESNYFNQFVLSSIFQSSLPYNRSTLGATIPKQMQTSTPLASDNDDSSGEAQYQNTLLKLPTEIRDEIYAHAFGKSTTRYRLTLGEIRLYMNHADYKDDIATCKTLHGFPSWLLTCKQIKTEAMDLFVRTLTFRTPSWHPNTTPITMHNTMVHEHGGLRNIRSVEAALSGRLRSYSSIRSGTLRRARLRASLPFVQL
jgi:hypothetical protein